MTTVMVSGSFDVLHDGNRSLRQQEPLHGEQERLRSVEEESLVDEALLGERRDVYRVLKRVRPDVVALGYDQVSFTDGLREKLDSYGLRKTRIIRLEPHSPERFKSSLLKRSG